MIVLGAFDAGIYITSFISVQNAARAAVLRNSAGRESAVDQAGACTLILDQLRGLPGVAQTTSCDSAPIVVTSVFCQGSAPCGANATSADAQPAALVTVRYSVPEAFRFPLRGPEVIAASAQMKLRSYE